ncbi:ABC transporter ATP-binding protein [Aeromicrobium sp. UC242_57]|uniref:ABC transporter ATP-binding protein n=1 Tax=Aeromicrobium sp. UC242_57 TaxID=3374624 RepID=UPI00378D668C
MSDNAEQPRIHVSDLEVHFHSAKGRVHALGPLNLDIRDREFMSVVGPSGCGKSTFLRILGGLITPSAGTVDLSFTGSSETRISTVFQDFGILPWKTVIANVQFGLRMRGTPRKEARDIAMHWIQRAGLAGFENSYPSQLSGGMRQRVAIARAFAVDPEVLLLDQPFASLDAQMREVMQEELLQLCRAGERTVVLITHSLDEAVLLVTG